MVNIIAGANIACILETDIFTAYQYDPPHRLILSDFRAFALGPELSCFMFHTGHSLPWVDDLSWPVRFQDFTLYI